MWINHSYMNLVCLFERNKWSLCSKSGNVFIKAYGNFSFVFVKLWICFMPENCVAVTLPPGIIQYSNCTQCLCCLLDFFWSSVFAEGNTLVMICKGCWNHWMGSGCRSSEIPSNWSPSDNENCALQKEIP